MMATAAAIDEFMDCPKSNSGNIARKSRDGTQKQRSSKAAPLRVRDKLRQRTLSMRLRSDRLAKGSAPVWEPVAAPVRMPPARPETPSSGLALEFAAVRVCTAPQHAPALEWGVTQHAGGCSYQEDAFVVDVTAATAVVAVFDGHGGEEAARFSKERLHRVVLQGLASHGDADRALLDGFQATEAELLARLRAGAAGASPCCGCTALVLLSTPSHLHVGWCGDSRAVVCRSGIALALTTDHSLALPGEVERVLAEGGSIEHGRVGGFLEVTRALAM